MAENSGIEWTDQIDPNAEGRVLGAYKSAAAKTGCTLHEWIERRAGGLKHCFRCRSWKAGALFSVDKSRRGGRTSACKECSSDASTASRYGMSPMELKAFRDAHKHECGICAASELLYVDHDHATGRPRGLLCPSCNSAIGLLGEDPKRFAAAVAYLEKHRG